MPKPSSGFQTRSYTNHAVQLQMTARGLTFRIREAGGVTTICVTKVTIFSAAQLLFLQMQKAVFFSSRDSFCVLY